MGAREREMKPRQGRGARQKKHTHTKILLKGSPVQASSYWSMSCRGRARTPSLHFSRAGRCFPFSYRSKKGRGKGWGESPIHACASVREISAAQKPTVAAAAAAVVLEARSSFASPGFLSAKTGYAASRPEPGPPAGLGRAEAPRAEPDRLPPRHDLQQELLSLLQEGKGEAITGGHNCPPTRPDSIRFRMALAPVPQGQSGRDGRPSIMEAASAGGVEAKPLARHSRPPGLGLPLASLKRLPSSWWAEEALLIPSYSLQMRPISVRLEGGPDLFGHFLIEADITDLGSGVVSCRYLYCKMPLAHELLKLRGGGGACWW